MNDNDNSIITNRLQAIQDAREIFWKHLRKIPFNVCVPEDSEFVHVGTTVSNPTPTPSIGY